MNNLKILITDLYRLIVDYETSQRWETKACTTWKTKGNPCGIIQFRQKIYVCNFVLSSSAPQLVSMYQPPNGLTTKEISSLKHPFALEIAKKKDIIYIAHDTHVTMVNTNLEVISSWLLPTMSPFAVLSFRGLKLDDDVIYVTISGVHQIFVCNSLSGTVLKTWGSGSEGSEKSEFNYPFGLTVDNNYVYVCDGGNHRIQVLFKEDGKYFTQWEREKGFFYPYALYRDALEEIFYIGDSVSFQLFTNDGTFIQRISQENQFCNVYGLCIMDDLLYVTDNANERIHIFQKE